MQEIVKLLMYETDVMSDSTTYQDLAVNEDKIKISNK